MNRACVSLHAPNGDKHSGRLSYIFEIKTDVYENISCWEF